MDPWNCCRTCLNSQCLYPIFSVHDNNKQLIDMLNFTVGIKVETNDNLPQHICLKCLNFLYEIDTFRKQVDSIQKELHKKLESNEYIKIKAEIKIEKDIKTSIDAENSQDDFDDSDVNTTIDNLQFARNEEKINEITTKEYETTVKGKKKRIATNAKTVKRKTHRKKKNTDGRQNNSKGSKKKKEQIKVEIECEYCHKILTSKQTLRKHNLTHAARRAFACKHCDKTFLEKRRLLMHCRSKHGYEKTDKCSYCDYKACSAEMVKTHERIHTGEKPYVCGECGAGFYRQTTQHKHFAIHLPQVLQCDQCRGWFKSVAQKRIHAPYCPLQSFRCGVCGNNFKLRDSLVRHVRRVHAMQPDEKNIVTVKI